MNSTKVKKIISNTLGGATFVLAPILGKPEVNYAVTDADEVLLTGVGLVAYGIADNVTGHEYMKEFLSGVGSGAFGLLGFDVSYSFMDQLLASKTTNKTTHATQQKKSNLVQKRKS